MMIPDTTCLEYVVRVGGLAVYRTSNKYEAHRIAMQYLDLPRGERSVLPFARNNDLDVWVEAPQF